MDQLHPSLWRTCRVLANEKRLGLVWELFREGESSVTRLGDAVGMRNSMASAYLRAVNARGIILSRRENKYVFYRPEANPEVEGAVELLGGLRAAYEMFMPMSLVMKHLTAFTHERRIAAVQAVASGAMEESQLSVKTGISPQALYRHLKKLETRGYIQISKGMVLLSEQSHPLSSVLLTLAVSS